MLRSALSATVAILLATAPAAGQLWLEGRAGAAVGNHRPAAAGLQTHPGLALSASAEYAFAPRLAAYAGYTRASFECRDGFCSGDPVTVTSHGLSAGLVVTPFGEIRVRGGLIRNAVDIGGADAEPGFGFELGAGRAIDLPGRLELRPEIVLRRHGGTTGGIEDATAVLTASVGIAVRIGGGS